MNNMGDLNNVWEIRALKRKDKQVEATKMLDRIAKQVQPIMRKHQWRVKLLSEMCPTNPRLLGLNVNRGVHVKLRLRRPNRDLDFYPFDQVLDTMLHELCHNVHGPHDAKFYKLWDELRKECEELMAKGVTGTAEGFDLPGRRLESVTRQPPLSSLRKTALAAAEKRAVLGSLMPSGPKRLGGDSSMMAALSPVQAAAMAAERRLQDDIWCGSAFSGASEDGECNSSTSEDCENIEARAGSSRLHNGAKAQSSGTLPQKRSRMHTATSSQSSKVHLGSEFVDLSNDDSVSGSMINSDMRSQKRSRGSETSSFPLSSHHHHHLESSFVDLLGASTYSVSNHDGTHNPEESAMWQCGTCTLLNQISPLAPVCELCSAQRPKDVGTSYKIWSCKFCTLENSVKLEKCSVCGQWRYSHGPPIATQPPNLGTWAAQDLFK